MHIDELSVRSAGELYADSQAKERILVEELSFIHEHFINFQTCLLNLRLNLHKWKYRPIAKSDCDD